ncbi:hypothetical protein TNCT_643001 [Trichonephila clavata]|uniref:Uncharacterized protein n=1 Tax=Trichonephila clavata TaxID=2740835 RepID=A0A8X6HG03_TRICU|nr:hypothetical protein TNCT_643001 [Trichonephila clavata]
MSVDSVSYVEDRFITIDFLFPKSSFSSISNMFTLKTMRERSCLSFSMSACTRGNMYPLNFKRYLKTSQTVDLDNANSPLTFRADFWGLRREGLPNSINCFLQTRSPGAFAFTCMTTFT